LQQLLKRHTASSYDYRLTAIHCPKERMNVRGGQGVVVDGDVGDFPFVIRVSKHAAINKKT